MKILDSAYVGYTDNTQKPTLYKVCKWGSLFLKLPQKADFTRVKLIAVLQLEALVWETIQFVEIHMPQGNPASAKRKLGWRQQPWTISELDQ